VGARTCLWGRAELVVLAMATRRKAGRRGRRAEGVAVRHAAGCAAGAGGGCSCRPSYQAQVWSARDRRPIRKTFATLAQARAWRAESQLAVRAGRLSAPTRATVAKAAARWLAGAEAGVVRTRSGERYKPSALRSYARALDRRLLPQLGRLRLSALTQAQLQGLVDGLLAEGRAASTARNAILPLRAIYRRAVERSELAFNPTLGLALPAPGGRRERVARPAEARRLLAALPARERGLWATALYAGLRRGELQALRWQDIELERRLLSVERSWDRVAGLIEPKSRAGRRRVPLPDRLRCELLAHRRPRAAPGCVAPGSPDLVGERGDHVMAV
jgi:integrase